MITPREEHFRKLIAENGLQRLADHLVNSAALSVGLHPSRKADADIGTCASKLGGQPDVPFGFEWPCHKDKPLSFLAQINLSEIANLDLPGPLPSSGLLSFFYSDEVWGFDPGDRTGFRVFHFQNVPGEMSRVAPPAVPPKKVFFGLFTRDNNTQQFASCELRFETFLSLPDNAEDLGITTDEDFESYGELLDSIGHHHRLFGFSEPIQSEMELECQLVTSGLYCGDSKGHEDPRAAELEKGKDRWKLLLQIDSDTENSDMMWGDAGRVYYWIDEKELHNHNFENCWVISQCH